MNLQTSITPAKPADPNAGFFAIDRRAWRAACELGLNPAVVYLLLARGSLGDNRTTSWSVHATEVRTGISRPKVALAIVELLEAGLLKPLNASRTKPRRWLVEGHLIPSVADAADRLTDAEKALHAKLPWPHPEVRGPEKGVLRRLQAKGLAVIDGEWINPSDLADAEPQWVWLPNSLVDGAAAETSPVEVLRQTREVEHLRLLIDLYDAHSLTFHGGISTNFLRQKYSRKCLGFHDTWNVWHFEEAERNVELLAPFMRNVLLQNGGEIDASRKAFWKSFDLLNVLGYVTFVAHLFDCDDEDAEILHPFDCLSWRGATTPEEDDLCVAGQEAAVRCLPSFLRPKYFEELVVPVKRHISHATLRGVARLRYRPRTAVTAQWRNLGRQWNAYREIFEKIGENPA